MTHSRQQCAINEKQAAGQLTSQQVGNNWNTAHGSRWSTTGLPPPLISPALNTWHVSPNALPFANLPSCYLDADKSRQAAGVPGNRVCTETGFAVHNKSSTCHCSCCNCLAHHHGGPSNGSGHDMICDVMSLCLTGHLILVHGADAQLLEHGTPAGFPTACLPCAHECDSPRKFLLLCNICCVISSGSLEYCLHLRVY